MSVSDSVATPLHHQDGGEHDKGFRSSDSILQSPNRAGHSRTFSNQGIGPVIETSSGSGDGLFSKITKYFKSSTPSTPTSATSPSSLAPSLTVSSASTGSIGNTNSDPDYYQQKQKQLQKKMKKKGSPKPGTISKVRGASFPLDAISEQIGIGVFPNSPPQSSFMNSSDLQHEVHTLNTSNEMLRPRSGSGVKRNVGVYDPFTTDNGSESTSRTSSEDVVTSPINAPFQTRNQGSTNALGDDEGVSESKVERFRQIINSAEDIDMDGLRKLSWRGIPSSVRATVWKVLLGYMPCNKDRADKILARKRKEYLEYVSKYYKEEHLQKTEQETAIQKQIHIDVLRTNPDLQLFQTERIQEALERILYIWSIRHPASGYVQGLNDLVTPFMAVFLYDMMKCDILTCDPDTIPNDVFENMECDSFWCFTQFIDFIQDHYTFAQPGIQRMVNKLEEIIQKIDEPLYTHLQSNSLEFIQFAFRWMNCLLMREISLKLVIRLFDSYISEGDDFESLHIYVCAAFLKTWSDKLLKMEFTDMVLFLQHLPTRTWTFSEMELLLSQAYMLKVLYDGNNHLN